MILRYERAARHQSAARTAQDRRSLGILHTGCELPCTTHYTRGKASRFRVSVLPTEYGLAESIQN
ncbi:hypothetical protein CA85_49640 [Allorhodopirellula solitaria]|uniref:Uncharacterized protein n=1 Tax=Allorhodopirellula solitaria TaxID=2527987 RepID=A0A5C5WXE7_9BACT|nr:hypothetical protein CA85_49640 [Allorhodopirellula solitaria]